jgi:hypothetical protein
MSRDHKKKHAEGWGDRIETSGCREEQQIRDSVSRKIILDPF